MHQTKLPNGLELYDINKYETKFLYQEIFVDEVYTRHQIHLESNAVVLDVGANIGMFAAYMAMNFQPKLYCFEPAPHCCEVLRENVKRLSINAEVFDVALGEAQGEVELTFYPNNTIMSSLVADLGRDRLALESTVQAEYELRTGEKLDQRFLASLTAGKLDGGMKVACPMTTLSAVIEDEGIHHVALAKIDVECAEGLVLNGLEDRHWNRINQFVIEVHDQGADEPRVMRDRIAARGFDAELFSAPSLANSNIYELSAKRRL